MTNDQMTTSSCVKWQEINRIDRGLIAPRLKRKRRLRQLRQNWSLWRRRWSQRRQVLRTQLESWCTGFHPPTPAYTRLHPPAPTCTSLHLLAPWFCLFPQATINLMTPHQIPCSSLFNKAHASSKRFRAGEDGPELAECGTMDLYLLDKRPKP